LPDAKNVSVLKFTVFASTFNIFELIVIVLSIGDGAIVLIYIVNVLKSITDDMLLINVDKIVEKPIIDVCFAKPDCGAYGVTKNGLLKLETAIFEFGAYISLLLRSFSESLFFSLSESSFIFYIIKYIFIFKEIIYSSI